jgi:four helix bundle protein
MQDFKKLSVWQKAHELALYTYRITADFPKEELFGLRNTLRKTSVDLPAIIAEACAKNDNIEFRRCVNTSLAFGNRLEYYALIAKDLQLLSEQIHNEYLERVIEVRKMFSGLSRRAEI